MAAHDDVGVSSPVKEITTLQPTLAVSKLLMYELDAARTCLRVWYSDSHEAGKSG